MLIIINYYNLEDECREEKCFFLDSNEIDFESDTDNISKLNMDNYLLSQSDTTKDRTNKYVINLLCLENCIKYKIRKIKGFEYEKCFKFAYITYTFLISRKRRRQ